MEELVAKSNMHTVRWLMEDRNLRRTSLGRPTGRRSVGRPKCRWSYAGEADLRDLQAYNLRELRVILFRRPRHMFSWSLTTKVAIANDWNRSSVSHWSMPKKKQESPQLAILTEFKVTAIYTFNWKLQSLWYPHMWPSRQWSIYNWHIATIFKMAPK